MEDFDPTENDIHLLSTGPAAPPGLDASEETGGAYITISQQASEREHRQAQAATVASTSGSAPASP